jgi:hypothetical protein
MGSRYIPVPIRRKLRQEVNYGCPIPGCGSPYLSYHHFDPPYHEGGTHDPEGMIALCLPHHKYADIGTYTDEQLRNYKIHPFLSEENVKGRIEWMRTELILNTGGITAYKPNVFLELDGKPIIWTKRSEDGFMLLNIDIKKSDGNDLLKVVDNDWIVTGPLTDMEAIPSGRSINITSKSELFKLDLSFHDITEGELRSKVEKDAIKQTNDMIEQYQSYPEEIKKILSPDDTTKDIIFNERWNSICEADLIFPALLVTLTGKVNFPFPIKIGEKEMVLPGNNVISGGTVINCNVAISINQ